MKYLIALPVTVMIVLFGIKNSVSATYSSSYQENDFRPLVLQNIKAFKKETALLKATALGFEKKTVTLKALRQQLTKTRLAYKQNECILEYYFPKHCKAYLNGAPLKHPDPHPVDEKYNSQNYYGITPQEYSKDIPLDQIDTEHYKGARRVVDPEGLQVLDELVFSDEEANEAQKISALVTRLDDAVPAVENALQKRNYFYDFEIIEAARLQLVRTFSLGVTGFDTPGSVNALPEAVATIESVRILVSPFVTKANPALKAETEKLLAGAKNYLIKNNDFDSFNRLDFLTLYINPLYKNLGKIQQQLHLPSTAERWGKVASWNAASENIFGNDFLNPYYYSLLPQDKDSEALRALGKKLFYEPLLSSSKTMSCASCHKPELAYSDGLPTSVSSVEGKNVLRNAPTLINAVYSDRYFYDLRAYDLEDQAGHVIENHMEFNTSFDAIVKQLNESATYKADFESVFGKGNKVTRYYFSQALSSYVISLRGYNSPFDKYIQGKTKTLSKEVKDGFNLFTGKAACATCHYVPNFSGLVPPLFEENESEVLGVFKNATSNEPDTDAGRFNSPVPEDHEEIYRGSFKTVTVRNATLTAPYFHNGGYKTLEEVIEFYDKGGAAGLGYEYEVPNQTLPPDHLELTPYEKRALIAFIRALNDNTY
ncbi:cytochrome-c peroxidase [Flavobacterium sp. RHBU_3]|uniref:cytochrome-c peroxidase n=1 Tax=Flavobacterium sp. RHBU_3 TaxID=3391184 RepID=UPI0039853332